GLALGHARLEQLFDARQARGDIDAGDATRVERTHGELRAWFTDRLRGHDANRVADGDQSARAHMPAVAVLADAMARLAGQRGAQVQLRHLARGRDLVADLLVDQRIALGDDFAGRLVDHVGGQQPAWQLGQAQVALGRVLQVVDPDALLGVAV